jgi:hypothetical protein
VAHDWAKECFLIKFLVIRSMNYLVLFSTSF